MIVIMAWMLLTSTMRFRRSGIATTRSAKRRVYIFSPSIDLATPFVSAFQFAQQFTQEEGIVLRVRSEHLRLIHLHLFSAKFADKLVELRDRIPSKTWITDIGFPKSILLAVSFTLLLLFSSLIVQ